nr:MAG TPA: hypothetical protein [Caudoviricetes sp.]
MLIFYVSSSLSQFVVPDSCQSPAPGFYTFGGL